MKKRLAVPTPDQVRWHDMEMGMFIHWAPNVYQGAQGDQLSTPMDRINPRELDADQWAACAEAMGAKYVILVAKHVGGFCLWQTDTTEYGIRNTPWKGGDGDIVREVSEACRRRGLRFGVYLSPCDKYHRVGVGGICEDPDRQAEYDALYRQQMTELLSRYGEICEVWFDGSTDCEVADILENLAPHSMVFQSKYATIRWVGNEDGIARYPAWNTVPESARGTNPTVRDSVPDGDFWIPLECDTTIRKEWFYNEANGDSLKSLEDLMQTYYGSVGNGAVLLLNSNPDQLGRIPDKDFQRARELGDAVRHLYESTIASMSGDGAELELRLTEPSWIDHLILMEDIRYGERVRRYQIEGWIEGEWRVLANGTAIGHKRIERIQPVCVTRLRFTALAYADTPILRDFSACFAQFPFALNKASYEPAKAVCIREWGNEIFYGNGNLEQELEIDLTGILTAVEDVGQYEIEVRDEKGPAVLLEAHVEIDGVRPDYCQILSDTRLRLFIPGVDSTIRLHIAIRLDGRDTQGVVLMRKE